MNETLETLLKTLCKTVEKAQQNAQQTLYHLGDSKDAKLAYDLLVTHGIEARYFADEHGGKLYVQNGSLAALQEKLAEALNAAPMLKHIKDVLDKENPGADYAISLSQSGLGRQLMIQLPVAKNPAVIQHKNDQNQQKPAGIRPNTIRKNSKNTQEDTLLSGPTVARTAIPKSFQASASEEDPLAKRVLLYASGRAFSTSAWGVFIMLLLGIIFTVLVVIKGFLCPDIVTDVRMVPSYCPQKNVQKQQQ